MQEPRLILERALTSRKLPPTWLVTGPEGSGKWALAMELARALLCTGKTVWGCGRCPSCRRVLSFAHADLFLVFPFPTGGGTGKARVQFQQEFTAAFFELKKDEPLMPASDVQGFEQRNRFIPVERVTELLNWASLRPSEGQHKVALVYEPELIVRSVTDKLLKLTEEPPPHTTLILASHHADLLPQTIRSRSRSVRTRRMGPRQLESSLVRFGFAAAQAATAARPCRGLVGPALSRVMRQTEVNIEEEALGLLSGLWAGSGSAFGTLQEWQWRGAREKVSDLLDVWALLVRDVSCTLVSTSILPEIPGELAGRLSGLRDAGRAERALAEIRRTQSALATNVHIGVALSALASRLKRWGEGDGQVTSFWAEQKV